MKRILSAVALSLVLSCSSGCGLTSGESVAPMNQAAYEHRKACLDALDDATEYIHGPGMTNRKDFLIGLVNAAFKAGGHSDLAAAQRLLDSLNQATPQIGSTGQVLANRFNADKAKCLK